MENVLERRGEIVGMVMAVVIVVVMLVVAMRVVMVVRHGAQVIVQGGVWPDQWWGRGS